MSTSHVSFPPYLSFDSFDPGHTRALSDAFENWEALKSSGTSLTDGHAIAAREVLAKCIIKTAKLGEHDQRCLRAGLAHLAKVNSVEF